MTKQQDEPTMAELVDDAMVRGESAIVIKRLENSIVFSGVVTAADGMELLREMLARVGSDLDLMADLRGTRRPGPTSH